MEKFKIRPLYRLETTRYQLVESRVTLGIIVEEKGAYGGNALQVGRLRVLFPMVSLEFYVDMIPPAALWPLTERSTRNISWGVKAAGV
jgi:hypothetical protein